MRPTKKETDLEFWTGSQTYWKQQAEYWFIASAQAKTPEEVALCSQNEDRANQRLFQAELAHQEATGEIVVYTGRAKPGWA